MEKEISVFIEQSQPNSVEAIVLLLYSALYKVLVFEQTSQKRSRIISGPSYREPRLSPYTKYWEAT